MSDKKTISKEKKIPIEAANQIPNEVAKKSPNEAAKQIPKNATKIIKKKTRKQKIYKRKPRKEDYLVKFFLGEKYIPARWSNEVRLHKSQFISRGCLKQN